jgi:hypothetical protein
MLARDADSLPRVAAREIVPEESTALDAVKARLICSGRSSGDLTAVRDAA